LKPIKNLPKLTPKMMPTLPPAPTGPPVPPKPPPVVPPETPAPVPFAPVVGEIVEGKNADGFWYRMNVTAHNSTSGTFEADVYKNDTIADTDLRENWQNAYVLPPIVGHWNKIYAEYTKPTVIPPTTTLTTPPPPLFLPGDVPGEWHLSTTPAAPGPAPAPAAAAGS